MKFIIAKETGARYENKLKLELVEVEFDGETVTEVEKLGVSGWVEFSRSRERDNSPCFIYGKFPKKFLKHDFFPKEKNMRRWYRENATV